MHKTGEKIEAKSLPIKGFSLGVLNQQYSTL